MTVEEILEEIRYADFTEEEKKKNEKIVYVDSMEQIPSMEEQEKKFISGILDLVSQYQKEVATLTDSASLSMHLSAIFDTLKKRCENPLSSEYCQIKTEVVYDEEGNEGIQNDYYFKALPVDELEEIRKEIQQKIAEQSEKNAPIPLPPIFIPKTHTSPNTRLSNDLQGVIETGEQDLIVAQKGKKNEITTYVSVNYEPGNAVHFLGRAYTEYDRQVYDAVVSLWLYGDKSHIITPVTVFKAMTGANIKPSPQQKEAVTKSIEKMRRIFAEVDATDEIKAYLKRKGIEPTKEISLKWNNAILSLEGIKAKNGQEELNAYVIQQEPLLLSYAKATDKLLTSPLALLDIKEVDAKGKILETSLPNTQPRIAIRGYLLRRILVMKRDKQTKNPHQSKIIRFDSLFAETGLQDADKKIKQRNRDYVFQALDFWKASGFIKDYKKQIGTRNAITGVEIKL